MTARSILDAVRERGDTALAHYAAMFNDPQPRRVEPAEITAGYERISASLRDALHGAAATIERFATVQRSALRDVAVDVGWATVGHRAIPLDRVGVYVPSGRYPLPSTLLMCAIPARVAGVGSIVACTPRPSDALLAAARVAEVSEIFIAGGIQAIGAMAHGTQSIERVDVIVGPGNAYVADAKRVSYGTVGIDAIAGPSEILIVASGDADSEIIAADLVAQAEHDENARPMFVTDCRSLMERVLRSLSTQLDALETAVVARTAIARNGIFKVMALDEAVTFVDRTAPEHLALHGRGAEALEARVRNYGTLFVGAAAGETFGDYGVGPNHVLPTAGAARFSAGLSVFTFLAMRTYTIAKAAPDEASIRRTEVLAEAEGLIGHKRAAGARRKLHAHDATRASSEAASG